MSLDKRVKLHIGECQLTILILQDKLEISEKNLEAARKQIAELTKKVAPS